MIKFYCTRCDKKLGVPDEFAGKMVKCSRCRQPTRVPDHSQGTEPEPIPDQPPLSESPLTENILRDLEASGPTKPSSVSDSPAPAAPPPKSSRKPPRIRCPRCNTLIAGDTEFCIACGCAITQQQAAPMQYEVDTSGRFYTVSKMPWFLLVSAFAAAIGVLGWIALAFSTTKESGYAALGVGALIGFVMMVIGHEYRRDIALLAATVTILAVPIGKYLTLAWVEPETPQEERAPANTRTNLKSEINENCIDRSVLDHDTLFYATGCHLVKQGQLSQEAVTAAMHYCLGDPLPPDQIPAAQDHCRRITQTFRDWPISKRKEIVREFYQKKAKKTQQAQQVVAEVAAQVFYKDRLKFAFQDWYIDLLWYILAILAAAKIGAALSE